MLKFNNGPFCLLGGGDHAAAEDFASKCLHVPPSPFGRCGPSMCVSPSDVAYGTLALYQPPCHAMAKQVVVGNT
jgi:hypothetical protein